MGCLIAHEGPLAGRHISLKPSKPRVIAVQSKGDEAGELAITYADGVWHFDNRSDLPCSVNGAVVDSIELNHGDELRCGHSLFAVDLREDDAYLRSKSDPGLFLEHDDNPDEDEQRPPGRRFSASRTSQSSAPGNTSGLISSMSRVFKRRSGSRADVRRLEELEDERQKLLMRSGRRALEKQGGIGLPEGALAQLAQGHGLHLRQEYMAMPDLDRYRRDRRRLHHLDAEIDALRYQLGLEPQEDSSLVDFPEPMVHQWEREERAFAAMDEMGTNEVNVDLSDEEGDSAPGHAAVAGQEPLEPIDIEQPADAEENDNDPTERIELPERERRRPRNASRAGHTRHIRR